MSGKHFNMGSVFGRVDLESIERKKNPNTEFINFQVNVSGRRCGSVRAFCRMWKAERFEPFVEHVMQRPQTPIFLKGFFSQFWDERNNVYASFTVYHWEERESDPRAAFILKGEVEVVSAVTLGQRLLLQLQRGDQEAERLELWLQSEKFLDIPQQGQLIEVKGYLRQENPEDDFGGSSGPVRAFVEQLRILG